MYTGSLPLGSHTSIFALSMAREYWREDTHSSKPSSFNLLMISRSKEQPLFLFALLRTLRSIAGLRYSQSIPSFVSLPGYLQRFFNAASDTPVASAACSIVSNSYVWPSGKVTLHDVSLHEGLKKGGLIVHLFFTLFKIFQECLLYLLTLFFISCSDMPVYLVIGSCFYLPIIHAERHIVEFFMPDAPTLPVFTCTMTKPKQ